MKHHQFESQVIKIRSIRLSGDIFGVRGGKEKWVF